jgi:hypothetical protein
MKALDIVMQGLMQRYAQRVPDVPKITQALVRQGIIASQADIENDHIAFRTLGVEALGIASFEKIFLHYGYQKMEYFNFESKKLNAYWYAPPQPQYPRIFISEIRVPQLSTTAQQILEQYTQHIKTDPVLALDLDNGYAVDAFLHSPLWQLPNLAHYQTMLAESEYAAWVLYNRYYLNHYTISVHNLPQGYNDIYLFNNFLGDLGITLNNAGGIVKISPDGGLLQSATVAQMLLATFADGQKQKIAGSYVEFAERKVLPQFAHLPAEQITRNHRRDGFETGNADKIFESTFTSQTKR